MSTQYDLFGEQEAAEARAKRHQQNAIRPYTCPSCGTTERNSLLFTNNHGYGVDHDTGEITGIGGFPIKQHPIWGEYCMAQYLVSNHITFAARKGDERHLAERMQRGRELGLDVETIAAEARAEME